MQRNLDFSVDEFYHILNRGIEKRKIFLNNLDKDRFVKLLYVCNSNKAFEFRNIKNKKLSEIERGDTLVDIGCYCLMDNHFHILIREKIEGGISLFMGRLGTSYSMYFNIKNKRKGRLFENNFKAFHANSDKYLKYLFSYIHLNPIKLIDSEWKEGGIKNLSKSRTFIKNYKYSSYMDYIDVKREENLILNKSKFPKYFESKEDFYKNITDWMKYSDD